MQTQVHQMDNGCWLFTFVATVDAVTTVRVRRSVPALRRTLELALEHQRHAVYHVLAARPSSAAIGRRERAEPVP